MNLLKAGACALALLAVPMAGCNTLGIHAGPVVDHQTAQKALIDCDTAYVAIATIAASPALPADKRVLAESIRQKAWDALQVARAIYATNLTPSVASLAALLLQAQTLTGGAQ